MTATDPSQMLSEMREFAYRLALAFGGEAERAETHERRLEFFQLFDRCFFSVRVATALELRLRRAAPPGAERAEREEPVERVETERLEIERAERYDERDREREVEREVEEPSLPVFLRTLGGIAADASALPGPEPAALPTLRELLARVTSEPAPMATPVAVARNTGGALRSRLAGSATALTLAAPARPRPGGGLPVRRATGPPRR
jgi:hypothetical protein